VLLYRVEDRRTHDFFLRRKYRSKLSVPGDAGSAYGARLEEDRAKLERMIQYAQSAACRWKILLDYFDEGAGFEQCGTCDNCVTPMEARIAAAG